MSYNNDGLKLAFAGYDNRCHVLIYQEESLSDPDSMESDAVSEGTFHHCAVALSSPGSVVRWHPTRNHHLVVAELNGTIRFFSSNGNGDEEKESFVCEYVINIGLKIAPPLNDIDFIDGIDTACPHDFVVSFGGSAGGLFVLPVDRALSNIERFPNIRSSCCGHSRVQLGRYLAGGSLLSTVNENGQLSVTDLAATRVNECSAGAPCVAIGWHRSRRVLFAATNFSIVAFDFRESN